MTKNAGATEFSLAYSPRGGLVTRTGYLADAKRIQNVLFGRPRAGDVDFGLAIQTYLMEIADDQTRSEIHRKATQLIAKYCPNVNVRALVVEVPPASVDPTGRGSNTVVIGITLGTRDGDVNFALLGTRKPEGTLVSSLVL